MSVCPGCGAPLFSDETRCEACGKTGLAKASMDLVGFAEGDVVQRRSGGPLMTVVRIDSEGILCEWAGLPSSGEDLPAKEKTDSERFTELQPAELRRVPEGGGEFGEDDDLEPE